MLYHLSQFFILYHININYIYIFILYCFILQLSTYSYCTVDGWDTCSYCKYFHFLPLYTPTPLQLRLKIIFFTPLHLSGSYSYWLLHTFYIQNIWSAYKIWCIVDVDIMQQIQDCYNYVYVYFNRRTFLTHWTITNNHPVKLYVIL